MIITGNHNSKLSIFQLSTFFIELEQLLIRNSYFLLFFLTQQLSNLVAV